VTLANLGLQGPPVLLGLQGLGVKRALTALKDPPAPLDIKVPVDPQDPLEIQEELDLWDQLGLMDLLDLQDQQAI